MDQLDSDSDSNSDILEDIKALEDALARETGDRSSRPDSPPSEAFATSDIPTTPDQKWIENRWEPPSGSIWVKRNMNDIDYVATGTRARTDTNVDAGNCVNYVGDPGLAVDVDFAAGTDFASEAGTSVLPHAVDNDFDFADNLQTRVQERLKNANSQIQERAQEEGEEESVEESLLELNLKLTEILQTTKAELQQLLEECEERRRQLQRTHRGGSSAEDSSVRGGLGFPRNSCCTAGMPYFKDRACFSQPKNRDVLLKEANNELQVVSLLRVAMWTKRDRNVLLKAVRRDAVEEWMTRCNREEQCPDRVEEGEEEEEQQENEDRGQNERRRGSNAASGMGVDAEEDGFVPRRLQALVGRLGEREFDWMKIALKDFDWKHTPDECRVMWNVFLHPDINKGKWQKSEDAHLAHLAKRYRCQNWDAIAAELKTNRSGYQCFIRYNTKNAGRGIHAPWRVSEGKRLKFLVETFRTGDYIPWGQVAGCMENRTKQQVYFRWNFTLAPHLKKGRFTKEEDETLLRAVEKHGRNFGRISSVLMPQRTCSQLSEHYYTLMARQRGWSARLWSLEDDLKLIRLYRRFGSNWSKISASFRERNRTQVRHRYAALMRYELKGVPLELIPNRSESSSAGELWPLPEHQPQSTESSAPSRARMFRTDPPERDRVEGPEKMLLHHFYGIPEPHLGRKRKLYSPQELEETCERIVELLKRLRAERLDLSNFEGMKMSELSRQVLFRLRTWDFEAPRPKSRVTAEQVEEYRRRMFGDAEETGGEREHYIPPLPFGAYLRKKSPATKKDAGIDCQPVSERFLIPYERSIPGCVVSAPIDAEFERLERLLTAPTRTSDIIHVKSSSSTGIERIYILTSKELQEQILEQGKQSRSSDSGSASRVPVQEQQQDREQELDRIRVPRLEDVEPLKPCFATLNCYQNLLSAQELLEHKRGRPLEPLKLRMIRSPGLIRGTNILLERLLLLFRIPIGMSKVPPPEMHGTDGAYLFDLDEIAEPPRGKRAKRKDSGEEDDVIVKKRPKVLQEEEIDIKHVISHEREELQVSKVK